MVVQQHTEENPMARKLCTICNTRTVGSGPGHDAQQAQVMGYCNTCMTEADWENTHSDYGHDIDGPDSDDDYAVNVRARGCWICHPELIPGAHVPKAGHKNTAAGSWNSHAACTHQATPKARAACRKAGGPAAVTPVPPVVAPAPKPQSTKPADRKIIRPDGSVARVIAPKPRRTRSTKKQTDSCPNVGIHTANTIKCACGFGLGYKD